ncbi:MAG TPA: LppX_LprAFG lipoprotein, partial [Dermatophilaceae bacterium]
SNPVKVAMKFSMKGMNLEAVAVGGFVYIKGIPGTTKPWLKVDPKGTDAFSVAMSPVAGLSKSADPRLLDVLIGGIKGHYLGTEQVGGVWTGRFAFELPMSALPAGLTAGPGMEDAHVAMDYWVGDDSLPRKVTTVIELGGKKESTGSTYSDWGKPVNIVAPPAAEVGPPPSM